MGKFEKIVVLTVLFLVTLILVVSLNTEVPEGTPHAAVDGGTEASSEALGGMEIGPEEAAELLGFQDTADSEELTDFEEASAFGFDPTSAMLAGQVTAESAGGAGPEAVIVEAAFVAAEFGGLVLPEGSILMTGEGLEATPIEDLFLHTWAEGDSYRSLAEHYYGDASFSALLKQVNEKRDDIPAGDTVFIPANDVRERDNLRERRQRVVDLQPIGSGVDYRTLEGDSLWKISKKHYGRGSDWMRIYEANRDVLSSPNAVVRVGIELKIP